MQDHGRHARPALLYLHEGQGRCVVGETFALQPGTVVLIPGWMTHHMALGPTLRYSLFSLEDLEDRPQVRQLMDGVRLQPTVWQRPGLKPRTAEALLRQLEPPPPLPRPVSDALARVHAECVAGRGAGELAEGLGYSLPYLTTLMSHHTGRSLGEWLNQARLDYAAHLLQHTPESVPDIAARCGFADLSHFRRLFKSRRGTTPSLWRTYGF